MNKKYIYSFVALLTIGLVSAGLVDYLSNQAEVSVTVESPVLLEISTDGNTWSSNPATLSFGSIYGGESVNFWIKDTNLADVPIIGYSSKLVTNDGGVTCNDFASVTANGNDISSYCDEMEGSPNKINFDAYTAAGLDAGEVNTNEINLVFKQNAEGTYIFTMQKMSA